MYILLINPIHFVSVQGFPIQDVGFFSIVYEKPNRQVAFNHQAWWAGEADCSLEAWSTNKDCQFCHLFTV